MSPATSSSTTPMPSTSAIEFKTVPSFSSINNNEEMLEENENESVKVLNVKCDAEIAEIIEDPEIVAVKIRENVELPKPLHNLIQRIFDPNALISALKGMKLDLEKLSLEQITQDQIAAARRILKDLAQELRHGLKDEHVKEATAEFYSLIPHVKTLDDDHDLPLLNNPRIIDSKASILNTLADIEIANRSIGDIILQHEYIDRKDKRIIE
uniref:NAD(+) ADP-ribosyltransferase n=1 Tax=Panagrolaimus superbus TaxID=310955 RepID=A0A914YGJ0_9BILA